MNAVCDLISSMYLPVHMNYSFLHHYACRLLSVLISKLYLSIKYSPLTQDCPAGKGYIIHKLSLYAWIVDAIRL